MSQLGLFAERPIPSPASDEQTRALAARLPRELRLGTSSWSFSGWRNLVWPDEPGWNDARCAREGLPIYARHPLLRTVGIDRSFYGPLNANELERLAQQAPPGFVATSKVWDGVTSLYARGPVREHQPPNPRFLDVPTFTDEVVAPYRGPFAEHAGPFVLEFPASEPHDPLLFARRMYAFLRAATPRIRPFTTTVEVRDRRLLTPELGRALADHGVPHCFTFHPSMPSLAEQAAWAERHGLWEGDTPMVVRLMLPPGFTYESRKKACAPFDRLVEEQTTMRAQVVDLVSRAVRAGRGIFVIVNNKAEGSAPLTIRALAERLAAG